jgi:hypothetical protein
MTPASHGAASQPWAHGPGDDRNALLMLTVQADFGAGEATLPGARLYLLDDNNKIKTEHVIFYAAQQ